MITITKAEEEVLNQVKSYSDDKMDVSIIKEDLGIYEHDLNDRLNSLKSKGLVFYDGATVQLKEVETKINTVDSKEDVINAELNQKVSDEIYDKIIDYAWNIGIRNAFIQEGDTQDESFIPKWDFK